MFAKYLANLVPGEFMRDFQSFTVGRYLLFQLNSSNYLAFDPETKIATPVRTPEGLNTTLGFCNVVLTTSETESTFRLVQLGGYDTNNPCNYRINLLLYQFILEKFFSFNLVKKYFLIYTSNLNFHIKNVLC